MNNKDVTLLQILLNEYKSSYGCVELIRVVCEHTGAKFCSEFNEGKMVYFFEFRKGSRETITGPRSSEVEAIELLMNILQNG